ncbi:hypothetical protein [Limibacterium fermenti]|jgi:hypothetical protein|uniref:hypothetical protein n=1 Tax=Limibacterium fermenti TaxID=3229863 RepID=UPI00268FBE38
MKDIDIRFLAMIAAVANVLQKYESVWTTLERFATEAAKFLGLKVKMEEEGVKTEVETSGATTGKKEVAEELFTMVARLSKRGSIYALDQDNMELHDQLRVSRGSLSKLSKKNASIKINDIYNRLMALGEAIVPYGITAENLTAVKALSDVFNPAIGRTRDLIIERSTHVQTIPEIKQDIRRSLYVLDSMVTYFAGTEFEAEYKNARKMTDAPKKKDNK